MDLQVQSTMTNQKRLLPCLTFCMFYQPSLPVSCNRTYVVFFTKFNQYSCINQGKTIAVTNEEDSHGFEKKKHSFQVGSQTIVKKFPPALPSLSITTVLYLCLLQRAFVSVNLYIRLTFLVCINALEGECQILEGRCNEYYVEKYCTKSCNRKY